MPLKMFRHTRNMLLTSKKVKTQTMISKHMRTESILHNLHWVLSCQQSENTGNCHISRGKTKGIVVPMIEHITICHVFNSFFVVCCCCCVVGKRRRRRKKGENSGTHPRVNQQQHSTAIVAHVVEYVKMVTRPVLRCKRELSRVFAQKWCALVMVFVWRPPVTPPSVSLVQCSQSGTACMFVVVVAFAAFDFRVACSPSLAATLPLLGVVGGLTLVGPGPAHPCPRVRLGGQVPDPGSFRHNEGFVAATLVALLGATPVALLVAALFAMLFISTDLAAVRRVIASSQLILKQWSATFVKKVSSCWC